MLFLQVCSSSEAIHLFSAAYSPNDTNLENQVCATVENMMLDHTRLYGQEDHHTEPEDKRSIVL